MSMYRIIHDSETCVLCGACIQGCPGAALKLEPPKSIVHDSKACLRCGACIKNCPVGALAEEGSSARRAVPEYNPG